MARRLRGNQKVGSENIPLIFNFFHLYREQKWFNFAGSAPDANNESLKFVDIYSLWPI